MRELIALNTSDIGECAALANSARSRSSEPQRVVAKRGQTIDAARSSRDIYLHVLMGSVAEQAIRKSPVPASFVDLRSHTTRGSMSTEWV